MDGLFKLLGVLLALYVVQSLRTGHVYAKWRWTGRTFFRDDDAWGYWSAIGSYVLLALALIFVF